MEKNKLTILADSTLCWMYLLYTLAIAACDAFVFAVSDSAGVRIVFMVPSAVWVGVLIFTSNQWLMLLEFRPDGIYMKPGVYKRTLRPYKYYPYVSKAWYWHGSPIGAGKNVDYIVISHRRLRDEEIRNINSIVPGADVIKIRYSDRTFQKLTAILPPDMQRRLSLCGFRESM